MYVACWGEIWQDSAKNGGKRLQVDRQWKQSMVEFFYIS